MAEAETVVSSSALALPTVVGVVAAAVAPAFSPVVVNVATNGTQPCPFTVSCISHDDHTTLSRDSICCREDQK